MPESRVRKSAVERKKAKSRSELAEQRSETARLAPAGRSWVPAVFLPLGLIGVAWMVTWNLAYEHIGFMRALGDWNLAIGLGLIVASFVGMTMWK